MRETQIHVSHFSIVIYIMKNVLQQVGKSGWHRKCSNCPVHDPGKALLPAEGITGFDAVG